MLGILSIDDGVTFPAPLSILAIAAANSSGSVTTLASCSCWFLNLWALSPPPPLNPASVSNANSPSLVSRYLGFLTMFWYIACSASIIALACALWVSCQSSSSSCSNFLSKKSFFSATHKAPLPVSPYLPYRVLNWAAASMYALAFSGSVVAKACN